GVVPKASRVVPPGARRGFGTRHPLAERQPLQLDLQAHVAALADVSRVDGQPVGQVDHRVRAGLRQRPALAQAWTGTPGTASEPARDPDEISDPRSVAPDELALLLSPA